MQFSLWMNAFPSTRDIVSAGHHLTQAPQAVHLTLFIWGDITECCLGFPLRDESPMPRFLIAAPKPAAMCPVKWLRTTSP